MNHFPLFQKCLRDIRWHILGYGIGLGVWAVVIVAIFPSIRDSFGDAELPEDYLRLFGVEASNFAIASNYFQAEFFSMLPVVLVIYAIVVGAGAIASEEGSGVLDIVLAQPVARRRLYVERVAAVATGGLAILALAAFGWVVALPLIGADDSVSIPKLVGATVAVAPFLAFWLGLSLLLAAAAASRGFAAGIATLIAVAMYLVQSIAAIAHGVEGLRYLSAFYYADTSSVLTDGLVVWHALVLSALAAACAIGGAVTFERKDLGLARSAMHLGVHRFTPRRSPHRHDGSERGATSGVGQPR